MELDWLHVGDEHNDDLGVGDWTFLHLSLIGTDDDDGSGVLPQQAVHIKIGLPS